MIGKGLELKGFCIFAWNDGVRINMVAVNVGFAL
jgi:hypothetical protein